jgi:hypothetical protein
MFISVLVSGGFVSGMKKVEREWFVGEVSYSPAKGRITFAETEFEGPNKHEIKLFDEDVLMRYEVQKELEKVEFFPLSNKKHLNGIILTQSYPRRKEYNWGLVCNFNPDCLTRKNDGCFFVIKVTPQSNSSKYIIYWDRSPLWKKCFIIGKYSLAVLVLWMACKNYR